MQKLRKKIIQNQNWHIEHKILNKKNYIPILFQFFLLIMISAVFIFPSLQKKITDNMIELCEKYDIKESFSEEKVTVANIMHTDKTKLTKILTNYYGQNTLFLNLSDLAQDIKQLEWVKNVEIRKFLNGTVYIKIFEYQPVAIWQNKGTLYLIDEEGHIISSKNIEKFKNLLLVIGNDALNHLSSIMPFIDKNLQKDITALIRVGERRWNMKLKSAVEIKLPENYTASALNYITSLYNQNVISSNDIKIIDLRIPKKIFITLNTNKNHKNELQEIKWN